MKRIATAVIAGATVATLAYASASVLQVESKPLQAGSDTVTCDADGVQVGWGFESDDMSVRSVTVRGIDAACANTGAKVFVSVDGVSVGSTLITAEQHAFSLPAGTGPADINDVHVAIG